MDPFGILYTDLYQLTMGQVYFRMGLHEKEALLRPSTGETPTTGPTRRATPSSPGWTPS